MVIRGIVPPVDIQVIPVRAFQAIAGTPVPVPPVIQATVQLQDIAAIVAHPGTPVIAAVECRVIRDIQAQAPAGIVAIHLSQDTQDILASLVIPALE